MNLLQSEDSWSPYKTFFLIVLQFHKILHRVKKSDPYNEICIIFRNWNKSFIAFFYFLNKVYLNSGYVVSPNIQDKVRLCLHFINLSTPDNHLLNLLKQYFPTLNFPINRLEFFYTCEPYFYVSFLIYD